jgi:hypothetical protein
MDADNKRLVLGASFPESGGTLRDTEFQKDLRMNATENEFKDTPKHLILSDRVYRLSVDLAADNGRAFSRDLVDFRVEGINPIDPADKWHTLLGMSEELYEDYPGYRLEIPLEWLLFRFLCHHVRTNSVHILSGLGGEVLKTTTFRDFLGDTIDDDRAEEILRTVFASWVRTLPQEDVELGDLYVSTDMSLDTLRRAINSLIFQNHIEESGRNRFLVRPSIFREIRSISPSISLDRRSNRYYQEIRIQADEPFCCVIMPFRKEEFDQRIYFDVIKPLVEDEFRISCYRVDEDDLPDRIDNKIYTYLLRSAFIIAEVTTCNPNVMYELGIAHMLEKDCIILTQKLPSEVPFDINRISAEPYESDEQLRTYLRRSIKALAFKTNR